MTAQFEKGREYVTDGDDIENPLIIHTEIDFNDEKGPEPYSVYRELDPTEIDLMRHKDVGNLLTKMGRLHKGTAGLGELHLKYLDDHTRVYWAQIKIVRHVRKSYTRYKGHYFATEKIWPGDFNFVVRPNGNIYNEPQIFDEPFIR